MTEFTYLTWKPEGYYVHTDDTPYIITGIQPETLEKCKTLQLEDTDVVIATYPKAGTTLMQEIVYLLHNGCDVDEARQRPVGQRVQYLEQTKGHTANIDRTRDSPCPRLVFTHLRPQYLQHQILSGRGRVIVLTRNPKDNLVSYYHFYRMNQAINFPGTWDQFFELARQKKLIYGDYFDWNTDWFRTMKNQSNVLFITFENLKNNRTGSIRQIAAFLDKPITDEQLKIISDATSFTSMKSNPSTNQAQVAVFDRSKGDFLRKGQVGDWKNYFNLEQSDYIDEKIRAFLQPIGMETELE